MHIEHEIRATVQAPIEAVWELLGSFGDMSWSPEVTASHLLGGDSTQHVGSVREIQTPEGGTIRERLVEVGPGRSFAYSFDGTPPIPVTSSRTTVTATSATAGSATIVTWHGEFEVADDDTRRTVEHINLEVVWPALIAALASALGVEHTIDTSNSTSESDQS